MFVIVDDYSRFTWVLFFVHNIDSLEAFKKTDSLEAFKKKNYVERLQIKKWPKLGT